MSQPLGQATKFTAIPSHRFSLDTCPTCGQEIPSDKLEEISGRIAMRERERVAAITSKIEKQFGIEKAAVEDRAKADLEAERQRSAAREKSLREESLQTTEKLQNEIEDVRRTSAADILAMQAQAEQREIEIRSSAMRRAELEVAERLRNLETASQESEAHLRAKIDRSEAARSAAEQRQAALATEIQGLKAAHNAETIRIKQGIATEVARAGQVAAERVELRLRDTIVAKEKAVAAAETRTREAEKRAAEAEANMSADREVLQKAADDAVNAERARAFEEKNKLLVQVSDLKRALENKTNEELGEGAHMNLLEELKAEFKDDKIERIPKGAPGADIQHIVMHRRQNCGTILYDSKNHIQWRNEHVSKLRRDQLAGKAEHAILSTLKFPQGTRQVCVQDGVLIANPARVVALATILRQNLIQVHTLRLSQADRESKMATLYEFITSDRCTQLLSRIDERADSLQDQQDREIRWHQNHWKKQGEAIRAIQKAKADLANEVEALIASGDESEMLEEEA